MSKYITIENAVIHNLKGINVKIPKNKLTVITGVSGSGKSSLAFDTLYEEGKKRYLLFSGTQFMIDAMQPFDRISGLSPTVAVEQRIIRQSNPRSTVGTRTKIGSMLAVLYATMGSSKEKSGAPLAMEMFQKNSPKGMCNKCLGTGSQKQVDEEKIFSDKTLKLEELCFGLTKRGRGKALMKSFCTVHELSPTQTVDSLTEEEFLYLQYGDGGKSSFPGYIPLILQIIKGGNGNLIRMLRDGGYLQVGPCPKCKGSGLGREAMEVKIAGKPIYEAEEMPIKELHDFLSSDEKVKATALGRDIILKLACMIDVGLYHLSLSRTMPTLSGGEIQRLFLASYIITEMESIVFIFDEPTIGLHEIEKESLIQVVKSLVLRGNTVVAVEHDKNFMENADYIIDLGPGAGMLGGEVIYQGDYQGFLTCAHSKTSPYIREKNIFPVKEIYKEKNGTDIVIKQARTHNLKNVTVSFPLGMLVGVAGVSGSGKSSLVNDTLIPLLHKSLKKKLVVDEIEEVEIDAVIEGTQHLDKCIVVDQRPIGRSKTSCPATYTGIYEHICELFSQLPMAVERKFTKGHFSLNSKGGCKICSGNGVIRHYVGYGNFVDTECETCKGSGFLQEVMDVQLEGKSILDILDMTVDEAGDFFKGKSPKIDKILLTLQEVGMGYIRLGQKTPTISGGESQRIKLAKELAKGKTSRKKGNTLYLFDEPTTGLAYHDSEKLLSLMQKLVDMGSSVIIIEHDPFLLSNCDYVIEMGRGGGKDGGDLISQGTPEELKHNTQSIIGRYLL